MKYYPDLVEKLIEQIVRLPGIGPKSAERIVNYILEESDENILSFSENLAKLKKEVKLCKKCFNLSERDFCKICSDTERDNLLLCVVEEVKDLVVIEKTGFKGIYHVLGGRISALGKVSPAQLRISQLYDRLQAEEIREVIIATNPTPEGEFTAAYLSEMLRNKGVRHSRLACGIPVGAEIEYTDLNTLRKSIEGRREL